MPLSPGRSFGIVPEIISEGAKMPFMSELIAVFIIGGSFFIYRTLGTTEGLALFLSLLNWIASMIFMRRISIEKAADTETLTWEGLDLDEYFHRERLQKLFDQYEVRGSMNVRDGQLCAVVPGDALTPLAKRLRSAVALVKLHPAAGADLFYMENGVIGLADLTIMEIEQAASVIEREAEDRNSSRKLYRGFGEEEVWRLARVGAADFVRNESAGDSDALILSGAIKRGECDDHPLVACARRTVKHILSVKGTNV